MKDPIGTHDEMRPAGLGAHPRFLRAHWVERSRRRDRPDRAVPRARARASGVTSTVWWTRTTARPTSRRARQLSRSVRRRACADARRLLADWILTVTSRPRVAVLRAQVNGLHTTASRLAGDRIGYADEVDACYACDPRRCQRTSRRRPSRARTRSFLGAGRLRLATPPARLAQVAPTAKLEAAVASLADDLRERTRAQFGLPTASTSTGSWCATGLGPVQLLPG